MAPDIEQDSQRGKKREGGIPAQDIQAQLGRILESKVFERSERLAAFLRYVVQRKLIRDEPVREVELALDVFERGPGFDSRTDPIVRVEAGRLRKALDSYYASAGAADPLVISIPARGYTPRFHRRKIVVDPEGTVQHGAEPMDARSSDTGPSIAVLPFLNMTTEADRDVFCQGVTEELINALTRIDHFKVVSRTSVYQFKDQAIDLRTVGKQLGVQTVVEGSVRADGERIRVTAQLSSSEDGFHLWSQTFDAVVTDPFGVQEKLGKLMSQAIAEQLTTN